MELQGEMVLILKVAGFILSFAFQLAALQT